ncbi:MAG: CAP domain-containing protein [Thermoleophilaceae bacterium]
MRADWASLALLAAVAALVLAAAPPAMAERACPSAAATPATVAKRIAVRATLCVLNQQRARHGLRPLKLNRRLSRAARRHARDMVRRRYFSHDSVGGASFVDRIRRTGYLRRARRWTVGENLAWGTLNRSAPRSITRMWMHSPGHRANILSPSFREVGIGLVRGAPVRVGGQAAATYATSFGAKRKAIR